MIRETTINLDLLTLRHRPGAIALASQGHPFHVRGLRTGYSGETRMLFGPPRISESLRAWITHAVEQPMDTRPVSHSPISETSCLAIFPSRHWAPLPRASSIGP
jgi:hypothetical protein